MSEPRHLPVRPNLEQLKHQAKDLLKAIRRGGQNAVADLKAFHPNPISPDQAKLADAQLTLARSYEIVSWPRLVHACRLVDAIWQDDADAIRALIMKHPNLLHENARGGAKCSWGPPMSYAANLGRDRIIRMLHELGAKDHAHAIDRAALQGKIETARMLHEMMGRPKPPIGSLDGPAYTLSASGTALMLELGARIFDDSGKSIAPVYVVLESDSRKPADKHRILELYVQNGLKLPDTPTTALHRGRIDLLEEHLRRDPLLLRRTFTHEEIYPPELGCHDEVLATQGTPLAGTTLLHLCVDYDELEIARWLIERGMNVDEPAEVDKDGFGGHTALFGTVVSQPNYWLNMYASRSGRNQRREGKNIEPRADTDEAREKALEADRKSAPFTALLLDHGANPNVRASLRKRLHPGYVPERGDGEMHEYRNVTALEWGERFHSKYFVSEAAMRLILGRGAGSNKLN